jgi:hypothetical protein
MNSAIIAVTKSGYATFHARVAAVAHFLFDDDWWWAGRRYADFSAAGPGQTCVYGPADLADALSAGGVAGSIPTTSYSRIFLSPSGTLTSMRSFFIFKTTS